jgi:hypothetical protein
MGEINVTSKRMYQGRITALVLPAYIPPSKVPLITHYSAGKKQTVQRRELPEKAPIQSGNGYSGEGGEDVRLS